MSTKKKKMGLKGAPTRREKGVKGDRMGERKAEKKGEACLGRKGGHTFYFGGGD